MEADLLAGFNDMAAGPALAEMLACCSSPAWGDLMTSGRPYRCVADAVRRSGAIIAEMSRQELASALAGHARIGEQPAAGPAGPAHGHGRGSEWSRQEQSRVTEATADTRAALAESNLEYEQRFGHIYLVCATGRTAEELLAALRARLRNDTATEWQVVRAELQKINELRLRKLLAARS
jgi:2-oxo-4-hydroxy-4-carboxy-5-ureidoimidazoline decarboxylase